MTIKLYINGGSAPVRATLMLAEILNLKYEPVELDSMAGDHLKPEFLEKNPNHTLPTLDDDGFIITDSHAILTYLVQKYGEKHAQLYPKELKARATVDQLLFFEASTVFFGTFKAITGAILRQNAPGPSAEHIKQANDVYTSLEKYLSKNTFVAGDHLTVADISCVSTVSNLDVLVPLDPKYVKLTAWFNALKNEDWYKKGNVPGLTRVSAILTDAMEKNIGKA